MANLSSFEEKEVDDIEEDGEVVELGDVEDM